MAILVYIISNSLFTIQPSFDTMQFELRIKTADIQGVPLATEPGISLIILPLKRILQRNFKQTYLIV